MDTVSTRDKVNAGERKSMSSEVCSVVTFYAAKFGKKGKTERHGQETEQRKWEPPLENIYKSNTDVAFKAILSQGGWGFVARDKIMFT